MLDFLKNHDEEVNFDEIKEICEQTGNEDLLKEPYFKDYMNLMLKGFDDPAGISFVCSAVIVALAHYHDLPHDLFKKLLEDMEESFLNVPDYELMKSMIKYDLV